MKSRTAVAGALVVLALFAGGCAQPAADEPVEAAEAAEAADPAVVAAQESVSGTTPLPELRTNDAGAVLVSQEEMVRLIEAGTAPLILDVRTPEEYAEGHVPGAVLIPHTELADRLAEIEAAREAGLIVYCRSGRRAGIAEELLLAEGFGNVQHLEGDMLAWLEANLPTEQQR